MYPVTTYLFFIFNHSCPVIPWRPLLPRLRINFMLEKFIDLLEPCSSARTSETSSPLTYSNLCIFYLHPNCLTFLVRLSGFSPCLILCSPQSSLSSTLLSSVYALPWQLYLVQLLHSPRSTVDLDEVRIYVSL